MPSNNPYGYNYPESTFSQFMPMMMNVLGAGSKFVPGGFGAAALGTGILGAVQTIGSLINRRKLMREPRPQYEIAPEMQQAYNLAEQRSRFGFTPQQTAAFEQQMARSQAADYANAVRMGGGGLAQAVAGGLGGQRLQALNRFAAQDAAQQAANIGQFYGMAGQMQAQRNRMRQQEISTRMQEETGVAKGLSSGLTNLGSFANAWGLSGFKNPFAKSSSSTSGDTSGTTTGATPTYEYPSWAYQEKTGSPAMPSGWFPPMAPGKPTPPSYLNMPSDPFTGSLYKQPSMLQLPE